MRLVEFSTLEESSQESATVSKLEEEAKTAVSNYNATVSEVQADNVDPMRFIANPLRTRNGTSIDGSRIDPLLPQATLVYRANFGGGDGFWTPGLRKQHDRSDPIEVYDSIAYRSAWNVDLSLGDYMLITSQRRPLQGDGLSDHNGRHDGNRNRYGTWNSNTLKGYHCDNGRCGGAPNSITFNGFTVPLQGIFTGIRHVRVWTADRESHLRFNSSVYDDYPPGTFVKIERNLQFVAIRVRNRQEDLSQPAQTHHLNPHRDPARVAIGANNTHEPIFYAQFIHGHNPSPGYYIDYWRMHDNTRRGVTAFGRNFS